MRTLAVIEFVTLDGVMQGLGSPNEDRDGGFEYGGWGAPYGDEVLATRAAEGQRATTAYLFGRKTYETMAARWPSEPAGNPIADHLNATPKYVATNTLASLDWERSHVLDGDVVASVEDLKRQGTGGIAVLGSHLLAQTLIEQRLVDECRLLVHPLLLGTGKRLFNAMRSPLALRLIECTPTTTGVLMLSYRPA